MLNWYQLEETAELAQRRVAIAGDNATMLEEIGVLDDEERAPMRRRLANAFINIGTRIDPEALEGAPVAPAA
jgi:hypothetical protein